MRRVVIVVAIAVIVVAIAVGAGVFAFRSLVGGEFALKDSDAPDALVAPKSGEPAYTLVVADLGSVAAPLDNDGPDVLLLARIDEQSGSVALVNLPASLQITHDNSSESLSSIALSGDAALVSSISSFAKVDIAHIVKVNEAGLARIVDELGGVDVAVSQVVDDPHAGSAYLLPGEQRLTGEAALTFLRATNLKNGAEDRLVNQLDFAARLLEGLFSSGGGFSSRIEAIGSSFQTDCSYAQLEAASSAIGGAGADGIVRAVAPGYFTAVTNATGGDAERFVCTSADMAALIDDIENGRDVGTGGIGSASTVSPSSFTVDVENGTSIAGAAATAADSLKKQGFVVGDVGNAESPVFNETLVVYRNGDAQGLERAKTVIEALGIGRAVEGGAYYTFEHDILLVIGADNKPVA